MQDPLAQQLPFLTRDMLKFEGTVDFKLRIISQSNSTSNIAIKGITRDSQFTYQHTPLSTGAEKSEDFAITDIPIFISVQDVLGSYVQGACFIKLFLLINNDIAFEFCSGNVWYHNGQSYPNAQLKEYRQGGGLLLLESSTDPAAGTEPSIIIGTYDTWKLQAVHFTLVTDANVANRRVHLVIRATGGGEYNFFSSYDHPASTTRNYTCAPVGTLLDDQDDNDVIIPIPADMWLSSGSYIKTETTNKQAGDNWGVMSANIEQFFEL